MDFEMRRRKSIVKFNLYTSRHPSVLIHAKRQRGMYWAKGVILFHWIFVGIEPVGTARYLVWNWGLKPVFVERP